MWCIFYIYIERDIDSYKLNMTVAMTGFECPHGPSKMSCGSLRALRIALFPPIKLLVSSILMYISSRLFVCSFGIVLYCIVL